MSVRLLGPGSSLTQFDAPVPVDHHMFGINRTTEDPQVVIMKGQYQIGAIKEYVSKGTESKLHKIRGDL